MMLPPRAIDCFRGVFSMAMTLLLFPREAPQYLGAPTDTSLVIAQRRYIIPRRFDEGRLFGTD